MPGFRRALWIIAIGAAVLVAVDVAIALDTDREIGIVRWSAPCLGATFAAAGITAWRRRPSNATGPLVTAVGYGWLLGGLALLDDPLAFSVGLVAITLSYAVLIHTYLAFPHGVLRGAFERVVVAGIYVIVAVAVVLSLLAGSTVSTTLFGEDVLGCDPCPQTAIELGTAPVLDDLALWLSYLGFVVLPALAAVPFVAAWRRGDRRHRAAVAPAVALGLSGALLLGLTRLEPLAPSLPTDALIAAGLVLLGLLPIAFVWVLLRGEFATAAGADRLVPDLEQRSGIGELSELVAGALGDRTARVLLWDEAAGRFVDEHGARVPATAPSQRARTEVRRHGALLAAIEHEQWLRAEGDVVAGVGEVLALAIENERLAAQRRRALTDVQASRRRLLIAADTERARISREIDETARQALGALAGEVSELSTAATGDPKRALQALGEGVGAVTDELRELVLGIMPPVLAERGLTAAIEELIATMPLPVGLERPPAGTPRPAGEAERAAYFVVSEALTNVVKYSRASGASVTIRQTPEELVVVVRDDGIGGADPAGGSGLRGAGDRLSARGGSLEVSSPPGAGTTVTARVPLTEGAAGPARCVSRAARDRSPRGT